VSGRRRPVYTGGRGWLTGVALVPVIACLSWGTPASGEEAWPMAPLPGGRAGLLPKLGLSADLPRGMVLGEIVRTVYPARDSHGRLVTALTSYLAAPPADGDELLPLPMPVEFWWKHVVPHQNGDRAVLGAILSDRRAALICYGLLGLDAETRAFVLANPAVVTDLSDRDASAFASFANIVRVHDGALVLPGGKDADAAWTALLGTTPEKAVDAIHALLTNDYERLALFAEAMSEADPAHLALVLSSCPSAWTLRHD
jgi:hypothetical protein